MTTLFFLLEGPDDERFFKSVLEKKFRQKYSDIKLYLYAGRPKKEIKNFVKTLNSGNKDYIILADFDNSTCVTDKKNQLIKIHSNFIASKIVICKCEIESWYLSGLNNADSKSLAITYKANTEDISKEDFKKNVFLKFTSRIDFMNEILKKFEFDTARKQNSSFEYFSEKYLRHCIKL